jgi:hypothetical protein
MVGYRGDDPEALRFPCERIGLRRLCGFKLPKSCEAEVCRLNGDEFLFGTSPSWLMTLCSCC